MTTDGPVTSGTAVWEAAYARFQTPSAEVRKFERRLRALGAARWSKDAVVLDLFCGRGNGMVALEQLGFSRVRGIDLSPALLAMHRERGRCLVGDCRLLPVRTASHDVVIVQGGLHHLADLPRDLERVVREVQRALKPGGLFVVVEPWQTPFLTLVHGVVSHAWARRAWRKLDALATMIEYEGETYRRWLREPALISSLLSSRFEPCVTRAGWGKLCFIGRARPCPAAGVPCDAAAT